MCCACRLLLSVIQRSLHAPSSFGGSRDTRRAYGCDGQGTMTHNQTDACDAPLPTQHTVLQSSRGSMESVSVFDERSSSINPHYEKKAGPRKKNASNSRCGLRQSERASSRHRGRFRECGSECARWCASLLEPPTGCRPTAAA